MLPDAPPADVEAPQQELKQKKDNEDAESAAAKGSAVEALPNNNKTHPQKNKESEMSQLEAPILIGNAAAADADIEAAAAQVSVPAHAAQAAAKALASNKWDETTSALASTKPEPLLTQNTEAAAATASAAAAEATAKA